MTNSPAPRRPNVIIIMTDQQRADHVGFGGNPVVQTPHLDSLAATGVIFDRAYVANPICMPNRASILTGRMPSVHGTRINGIPLDRDSRTFARSLRAAGYRTSLIGKAHFQNLGDAPKRPGDAPVTITDDAWDRDWPEGWDQYEMQDRYRHEDVEVPADYYGFDEVDLVINHADYASGHYLRWLMSTGFDVDRLTGPRHAAEVADEWWQVYKPNLPEELYPTSYVGNRAVEFIDSVDADEPFLLQVSFADPHHPFTPPGRYWDMYDPADVNVPATFATDGASASPYVEAMWNERGSQPGRMAAFAPTEAQLRRAMAAEYGAISMIDDAVGSVLQALDRRGLRENTYIVFTSDHGDMFGDHGILLKAALHYDGVIRVPLTISGPGIDPGQRRSQLVSSIDIAPTILDLTDQTPYAGIQGSSLRDVLSDSAATTRDQLLVEEDQFFSIGVPPGQPLRMRTVVTESARLTRYAGSEFGELFDRAADPDEMTNLYGNGSDLERELDERLRDELMLYADTGRVARNRA